MEFSIQIRLRYDVWSLTCDLEKYIYIYIYFSVLLTNPVFAAINTCLNNFRYQGSDIRDGKSWEETSFS